MKINPPSEDDVLFVRGPFDNQLLKVQPKMRRINAVMPFGDKMAEYEPVTERGKFIYRFVKYHDRVPQ